MSSLALLYGNMVNMISPELQVISCSWGSVYYKNIKKYLVSLSGLHLEINGETLKDMGYNHRINLEMFRGSFLK